MAIAQAHHSYAELRSIQERIEQQMSSEQEPGAIQSAGVQVMINRATVGIYDPDDERLAELSDAYGATAICFEIQEAPSPPADGIETLAKATDSRGGLTDEHGMAFAVFEVAFDFQTAEAAWRDNVPEDLAPREDQLPADPGVCGDLDQVDFDRQAVVVWSSGQSGSCPEWLADIERADGTIMVERERAGGMCTDDYNPYRVVLVVDRDRLPPIDGLGSAQLDGVRRCGEDLPGCREVAGNPRIGPACRRRTGEPQGPGVSSAAGIGWGPCGALPTSARCRQLMQRGTSMSSESADTPGTQFGIAKDGNRVLGLPAGYVESFQPADRFQLAELAVDPEHQRSGLTSGLVAELLDRLAASGPSRSSSSPERHKPVHRFWRTQAFGESQGCEEVPLR